MAKPKTIKQEVQEIFAETNSAKSQSTLEAAAGLHAGERPVVKLDVPKALGKPGDIIPLNGDLQRRRKISINDEDAILILQLLPESADLSEFQEKLLQTGLGVLRNPENPNSPVVINGGTIRLAPVTVVVGSTQYDLAVVVARLAGVKLETTGNYAVLSQKQFVQMAAAWSAAKGYVVSLWDLWTARWGTALNKGLSNFDVYTILHQEVPIKEFARYRIPKAPYKKDMESGTTKNLLTWAQVKSLIGYIYLYSQQLEDQQDSQLDPEVE